MAQNIERARVYFGSEEIAEVERYSKAFLDDLNKTDLDDATKEKYYKVMMDYKENKVAANVFGKQYNELIKKNKKLAKLYNSAPNDAQAAEYLKQIQTNEGLMVGLKAKYDYFNKKCDVIDKQYDITRIDNVVNARLEVMGYDMGMDERPKLPSEENRTNTGR